MDWSALWEASDRIGVVALLLLFGFAGYKKWIVFGWAYREEVERADKWEELALDLLGTTQTAVQVSEDSMKLPMRSRTASDIRRRRMR